MQVRIVMVVMQDAFQIGAVQHCHGVRPRSRSVHTFTKLFHWHQHVSLSHHVISDTTALAHMGRERRRSVCEQRPPVITTSRGINPASVVATSHPFRNSVAIDKPFDRQCSERLRARSTCGARLYTECGVRTATTSRAPGLDRFGPCLGYHIVPPIALTRIMRRSMPAHYHLDMLMRQDARLWKITNK